MISYRPLIIFVARVLLLILGLVLLLDSLYLLAQKKMHIGIVLPLLIGTVFIIYAVGWHKIHPWLNQHMYIKRLWLSLIHI